MDRWYWTASTLLSGELAKYNTSGIRLYDGDKKTGYEDGHLTVTNLRLLWKHSSNSQSLALSLALVVLVEEESSGFMSSAKIMLHLGPAPPDQAAGPVGSGSQQYMKLSFRQGGVTACMTHLQASLSERAWERVRVDNLTMVDTSRKAGDKAPRAGILGIERAIQAKQAATSQSISVAFEDLKHLMVQAKEMVSLSHRIATRIKEQGGDASSDETTQFRSCLLSLGIDDPVTREAVGSTTEYHKKLAKEIATALETPVREAGGVMLLSEVYCRINRARGLELLSPEDVANACGLMSQLKLSVAVHTFHSGVQTLQLASLNTDMLVKETRALLEAECGGREGFGEGKWRGTSAGEMARISGLPLLLAKERLQLCERHAAAVRDESSEGIKYFPNYFDDLEL